MTDTKITRIKKKILSAEIQMHLCKYQSLKKTISLLEQKNWCELMTKREIKFFNLKHSTSKVLAYEKEVHHDQ